MCEKVIAELCAESFKSRHNKKTAESNENALGMQALKSVATSVSSIVSRFWQDYHASMRLHILDKGGSLMMSDGNAQPQFNASAGMKVFVCIYLCMYVYFKFVLF